MAKWYKFDTLMRNIHEEEESFRLGLEQKEPTAIIRPVMIDLSRIETYSAMFDKEGEEVEDESVLTMHSGVEISVKMPFYMVDKLIRKAE